MTTVVFLRSPWPVTEPLRPRFTLSARMMFRGVRDSGYCCAPVFDFLSKTATCPPEASTSVLSPWYSKRTRPGRWI